jgi:hypothetical protein
LIFFPTALPVADANIYVQIDMQCLSTNANTNIDGYPLPQEKSVLQSGVAPHVPRQAPQSITSNGSPFAGKVWEMSQHPTRCHEVQKLLVDSSDGVRIAIAEELRSHIWEAIHHPHANFVVQKCIETVKPEACQFIIDELLSSDRVQRAAQHKFGCRVLQRLIEYCTDQAYELVRELLRGALVLTKNKYGVYVIQHILRFACKEHQCFLLNLFVDHASELCCSNISCTVIEAVLSWGDADTCTAQGIWGRGVDPPIDDKYRLTLARAILEHGLLPKMACSRHGHMAVRSILKLFKASFEYETAQDQLIAKREKLTTTRYGRSILRMVDREDVSEGSQLSRSSGSSHQEATPRWADMLSDTDDGF